MICRAGYYLRQNTSDGLFTLAFVPTYPTSAPSAKGFDVLNPAVDIHSIGLAGLIDVSIRSLKLTGSKAYSGQSFIGAIKIETIDAAGVWNYVTQCSACIGSSKGIYM